MGITIVVNVEQARKSVLTWRVAGISPISGYWVKDHLEPECWNVEVEVSNNVPDEVIVDWNRDQSAFKIEGQWQDLGTSALMPYVGPNDVKTFPIDIPRRAQACRVQMYYETGPLWSTIDTWLKDHEIYLPDAIMVPLMKLNKGMPGHFRRLTIEVELPRAGDTNRSAANGR